MVEILKGFPKISFEINDKCSLESIHQQCPRNHNRFRDLDISDSLAITTKDIIEFIEACDNLGFEGIISLIYYNEPMETRDVVSEIVERFPNRVTLWTNGVLLRESDESIINKCHDVMITVYPGYEDHVNRFRRFKNVVFQRARLDERANEQVTPVYSRRNSRCGRPDYELNIDYYGYGHICCGDWRAEMYIGNIKTDDHIEFLKKWDEWRTYLKSKQPWSEEDFYTLPDVCQHCLTRSPGLSKAGLPKNKR